MYLYKGPTIGGFPSTPGRCAFVQVSTPWIIRPRPGVCYGLCCRTGIEHQQSTIDPWYVSSKFRRPIHLVSRVVRHLSVHLRKKSWKIGRIVKTLTRKSSIVYESIICSEYYGITDPSLLSSNGYVEERYCKVAPIQEELALLRGWQDFFDYLPGTIDFADNKFPFSPRYAYLGI